MTISVRPSPEMPPGNYSRQLSSQQIKMLKTLANKPDTEIDLSNIPEAGNGAWKDAVPGAFSVANNPGQTDQ
ncbi:hypothetical protein [Thiothrix nivea]|uniref:hypothetical protein n=1 Tax=Thiothrix nivea TaxID=1031 RepID=UPI0012B6979C|nr:hypothetical protein [Thiothrix nivea]